MGEHRGGTRREYIPQVSSTKASPSAGGRWKRKHVFKGQVVKKQDREVHRGITKRWCKKTTGNSEGSPWVNGMHIWCGRTVGSVWAAQRLLRGTGNTPLA